METTVEEYVLVPKHDCNRTSLPPPSSKPLSSGSEIQWDQNKLPTPEGSSYDASVVRAKKQQVKPRKYNKRHASDGSIKLPQEEKQIKKCEHNSDPDKKSKI